MKPNQRIAAGILALVACAAFVFIYGSFAFDVLAATKEDPATIDSGFAFVAVGLAGIVTSALAAWFGVEFPDPNKRTLANGVAQLGSRLVPSRETAQSIIGWVSSLHISEWLYSPGSSG